ncbi:MAG: serine/threonine-protein kinase [Pirellulaceae bacterium]|jgi:serine/threonine-protein kinase|nr:serine/threonine-protein kinase [Pirellulaceae bacterium]MDP7014849.1 serine/threonine-protein kinase [Pirellulaceae bacterium]
MADAESSTPDTTPDPELSGRQFGDYLLVRRLGRGGMADVYLAEQVSLKRQVAFKVLKLSLASDTTYVRRFHNEAQAAAKLVHGNIVQIHDVGCVDGHHYIVQEYVSGQNLREWISRSGPCKPEFAFNVLRQVAAALHRAGEEGITHRDIKPENIMLSKSGELKVADFGLARMTTEGEANLTQVGVTMGTPLYMSPEQAQGQAADPRSDLYSLGVTIFHMLAGRPPFEGDTALSIALQHWKKDPERLENLRPELPGALCRLVHQLLAKDPDERFQRPAELLQELRLLQDEAGDEEWAAGLADWTTPELAALADARAAATEQLASAMLRERDLRRRRRLLVLGLGACIALAFAGGVAGAFAWRPADLLDVSDSDLPQVEEQESAREQYLFATLRAPAELREDALLAVARFFPPDEGPQNEYWTRLSWQQLAEVYMVREEYAQARELYQRLADVEETEVQFRLAGLVGLVNAHMRDRQVDQARQAVASMVPLLPELSSRSRRRIVDQIDPSLRPDLERAIQVISTEPDGT